jgi:hypothetical protein
MAALFLIRKLILLPHVGQSPPPPCWSVISIDKYTDWSIVANNILKIRTSSLQYMQFYVSCPGKVMDDVASALTAVASMYIHSNGTAFSHGSAKYCSLTSLVFQLLSKYDSPHPTSLHPSVTQTSPDELAVYPIPGIRKATNQ